MEAKIMAFQYQLDQLKEDDRQQTAAMQQNV